MVSRKYCSFTVEQKILECVNYPSESDVYLWKNLLYQNVLKSVSFHIFCPEFPYFFEHVVITGSGELSNSLWEVQLWILFKLECLKSVYPSNVTLSLDFLYKISLSTPGSKSFLQGIMSLLLSCLIAAPSPHFLVALNKLAKFEILSKYCNVNNNYYEHIWLTFCVFMVSHGHKYLLKCLYIHHIFPLLCGCECSWWFLHALVICYSRFGRSSIVYLGVSSLLKYTLKCLTYQGYGYKCKQFMAFFLYKFRNVFDHYVLWFFGALTVLQYCPVI